MIDSSPIVESNFLWHVEIKKRPSDHDDPGSFGSSSNE